MPVPRAPSLRTPGPPPPGSAPLTAPPRCARKRRPPGQSGPVAPPRRCVPRPSPPGGRRVSPPLPSPNARRARRCRSGAKMASIMEGPLSKWTNVMKGWQYRWFVLDYNAGLLSYYTVRGGGRAGRAGEEAPGTGSGAGWGRGGDSGSAGARAANGRRGGGGSDQWGARRRWDQPMGRRCGEMEWRGRGALLLLAAGGAAGGSGRGTRPGSPGSSGATHPPRAARVPEPCSVLAESRCSPPCPAGTRAGPGLGAQPGRRARAVPPSRGRARPALRSRGSRCVPAALGGLAAARQVLPGAGSTFPFPFSTSHFPARTFYCGVLRN